LLLAVSGLGSCTMKSRPEESGVVRLRVGGARRSVVEREDGFLRTSS